MTAGDLSPARRVATMDDLERAGDYTGPIGLVDYDGNPVGRHVLFLLPTHKGTDKYDRPDEHSGIHGVDEPPWTFRECPDGSLEIRASIGCIRRNDNPDVKEYYWHGYLDEGNVWREV